MPTANATPNAPRAAACAFTTALLLAAVAAPAHATPPFDVAYRAWEVVTALAKNHSDPNISGACGKTFRPFVIPGLRRQTRQEEDGAATACFDAARSACAEGRLKKPAALAAKCEEFR